MTNKLVMVGGFALALTLLGLSTPAQAQLRDLCDSTQVCEYTGPNAPILDADVCLDAAGEVRLRGSTGCAPGSWAFHVRYGEVYDPLEQLVVAYIPLANACSVAGTCEPLSDGAAPQTNAQGICCVDDQCWPGVTCGGTLMWCEDGVCNEDGTVTCFESDLLHPEDEE